MFDLQPSFWRGGVLVHVLVSLFQFCKCRVHVNSPRESKGSEIVSHFYEFETVKVLLNSLVIVKAAPHECVIRTGRYKLKMRRDVIQK